MMNTNRLGAIAFSVALVLAAGGNAAAQGNLLDSLKGLLGNVPSSAPGGGALTTEEIAGGLREALKVGTGRVVDRLGSFDGFNADPEIHIPLPATLAKAQSALEMVGMSRLVDDVELKLNRAAEAATPRAKEIFWQAISAMSFDDVMRIYEGPKDAATSYFRDEMAGPLAQSMRPVVEQTLSEVGAIKAYDSMIGEYEAIPFVPDVKADLTEYALEKSLDGLFLYLAREEAAIRENPAKRTTEILQRVFGSRT